MIKIYGLATSHNRYEKALKSIESLFAQLVSTSLLTELIIVDDGSIVVLRTAFVNVSRCNVTRQW